MNRIIDQNKVIKKLSNKSSKSNQSNHASKERPKFIQESTKTYANIVNGTKIKKTESRLIHHDNKARSTNFIKFSNNVHQKENLEEFSKPLLTQRTYVDPPLIADNEICFDNYDNFTYINKNINPLNLKSRDSSEFSKKSKEYHQAKRNPQKIYTRDVASSISQNIMKSKTIMNLNKPSPRSKCYNLK